MHKMAEVIEIVKKITLVEFSIILLIVFFLYLTKLFFVYTERKKAQNTKQIQGLLEAWFQNPTPFGRAELALFRDNVFEVLHEVIHLEKSQEEQEALMNELSPSVLKPKARVLCSAFDWFKRYTAALCYTYGFDEEDEVRLLRLIQDKTMLVSLNAATAAVKYANPLLINALIDFFAKGRRIHQSTYTQIIAQGSSKVTELVLARLQQEQLIAVKVFCYRLLSKLPLPEKIPDFIFEDFQLASIDLTIALLKYLAKIKDPSKNSWIYLCAVSENWEIRAIAAKALLFVETKKALELLAHMIRDSQWWVRINAASVLVKKGPAGIEILEKQNPKEDRFAFETASKVLKTLKIQ